MRHDPNDETSGAVPRARQESLSLPGSGSGPGLLLLPDPASGGGAAGAAASLFAEEGYVVLALRPDQGGLADLRDAVAALRAHPACTGGVGALGFGQGADLAVAAAAQGLVDCAVGYDPTEAGALAGDPVPRPSPAVAHRSASGAPGRASPSVEVFTYPGCQPGFASPGGPVFDKSASLMAHTRTLTLLRRVLGPRYDLEALWEQHTALEFASRDAEATMTTMVAEPYVNHIPTMTGGVGYRELLRFYKHHFIPTTPEDARLVPVSRTVGVDRLVDEFVFTLTHDREVDWLLPGVPPTGRRLEIPMLAVVRFRGDKLYNEHIYWDQASVLVQAGLLEPGLLPVAGVETARKLLDETLPSNALLRRWPESEAL